VQVSDAVRLYNALIAEKVIVRDRSRVKGCSECLRITIGTPDENDAMLAVVKNWK
jgi:histidinol-phosphate aminotransferase